ncbi:MAG: DNA gyrase inhibitor YacG [Planctomycetes bacterium]|nr:DNA gyrase inhibitor YacG [Planctomycetota bacterium]
MPSYTCTICSRPVTYDGSLPATYPICNERCRRVDLGLWLRGAYTLGRELLPDELDPGRITPEEPADSLGAI